MSKLIIPLLRNPTLPKEMGKFSYEYIAWKIYHPEIVGMASRVAKTLLELTYSKIGKTQFKRMGVIYMYSVKPYPSHPHPFPQNP